MRIRKLSAVLLLVLTVLVISILAVRAGENSVLLFCAGIFCAGISNAADMYIRDESLSSAGAYSVGEVHVPPRFLVERFGAPSIGDGIRVSGQYTFRSKEGVVFTIHDYKSTTLWVTDEGLPTPEAFWRLTEPVGGVRRKIC